MWTEWDEEAIEQELSLAEDLNINFVTIFINYWTFGGGTGELNETMMRRLGRFIDIADSHGLRVLISLFDYQKGVDRPIPFDRLYWEDQITQLSGIVREFIDDKRVLGYCVKTELDVEVELGYTSKENAINWGSTMIEKIRELDPSHPVTIELAYPPNQDWFNGTQGAAVDFVSQAFYASNPGKLVEDIQFIRECMNKGKPILIFEFGRETYTWTEEEQSLYIENVLGNASQLDIGVALWTLLDFTGEGVSDVTERHFGLLRADYTKKPSFDIYATYKSSVKGEVMKLQLQQNLFYDNFSIMKDEWQSISGDWQHTITDQYIGSNDSPTLGGIYIQRATDAKRHISIYTGLDHRDFILDVWVSLREDQPEGAVGIIFGYQDSGNYYSLLIDNYWNSLVVKVFEDGREENLASLDISIDEDTWYRLTLISSNSTYTVQLNGILRLSIEDNRFPTGKVGLTTWKINREGRFDDFRVYIPVTATLSNQGSLLPHDPIKISSNTDFIKDDAVIKGSGTPSDPYRISGFEIEASQIEGVKIENTDVYFVIENLWIHGEGSNSIGIRLINVSNGVVQKSIISDRNDGISDYLGYRNVIAYNDISENTYGIVLNSTRDDVIMENQIHGNTYGIKISNADPTCIVYHNNIWNNTIQVSTDSTITWSYNWEGNYWGDHPIQDIDHDGIIDNPYIIDEKTQDAFPFTEPFGWRTFIPLQTRGILEIWSDALNYTGYAILTANEEEAVLTPLEPTNLGPIKLTIIDIRRRNKAIFITAQNITLGEATIIYGGGLVRMIGEKLTFREKKPTFL